MGYGYGSIPINTIFRGMNIHLPAILMWTTGVQGFDTLPWNFNVIDWNFMEIRGHIWNWILDKSGKYIDSHARLCLVESWISIGWHHSQSPGWSKKGNLWCSAEWPLKSTRTAIYGSKQHVLNHRYFNRCELLPLIAKRIAWWSQVRKILRVTAWWFHIQVFSIPNLWLEQPSHHFPVQKSGLKPPIS